MTAVLGASVRGSQVDGRWQMSPCGGRQRALSLATPGVVASGTHSATYLLDDVQWAPEPSRPCPCKVRMSTGL